MEADGVFEGGGVKGMGLVGALKRAEEERVTFKRLAGTSAGAVVASLYAAGYSADELKELFYSANFKDFLGTNLPKRKGWRYFVIILNILFNYGIHSSNFFYKWIKEKLEQKGVSRFKDLKSPLKIITSDITNKRTLIFDSELHKEMEVAEAVRMSISIPLFFHVYKWINPEFPKRKTLVVDGGLLSNYSINIFDDHERQTIGFKLISPEETQPPEPITNVITYVKSILNTMLLAHEKVHMKEADWARTIPIPTGDIKTTQFDLTNEEKDWLYKSGYEAATKFFEKQKKES